MDEITQSLKIDRTVLDRESVEVIQKLIQQAESEFGDVVTISQKTIVNFLLQKRSMLLSKEELARLKEENYDIVKALKVATTKAIEVRQNGGSVAFEDILKIIQTPSVIRKPNSEITKGDLNKTTPDGLVKRKKKSNVEQIKDYGEGLKQVSAESIEAMKDINPVSALPLETT